MVELKDVYGTCQNLCNVPGFPRCAVKYTAVAEGVFGASLEKVKPRRRPEGLGLGGAPGGASGRGSRVRAKRELGFCTATPLVGRPGTGRRAWALSP